MTISRKFVELMGGTMTICSEPNQGTTVTFVIDVGVIDAAQSVSPSAARRVVALDTNVLLGTRARLPVRLVAIPVPTEVANARRRALRHNRNGSVHPSAEHLALLDWELFITTVPSAVWTANPVGAVYGVRWRIELIFNAWKQHVHLPHVTNASQTQVEGLIMAKLLWITLFQVSIFRSWAQAIAQQTHRILSVLNVTQFLTSHCWLVLMAFSNLKPRS